MKNIFNEGQQDFLVTSKARWFLKQGDQIHTSKGFTSKDCASLWIDSLGSKVDWRAGFVFRMKGGTEDLSIVSRSGQCAKVR